MASTVVRKIKRPAADELFRRLAAHGFVLREPPQYAAHAAKGPGVSLVWYTSGKLVVQGKGAADFASSWLDDPDAPGGRSETDASDRVDEPIIGSDESGKGDYFGPLVVAAVLVRPDEVPLLNELGVRDSKTVSDADARRVGEEIELAFGERVEVISISPRRYNEMHTSFGRNLNRLLGWAHAKAITEIRSRVPCDRALVDRFAAERVVRDALGDGIEGLELIQRVRAESHPAVAAASLVARARFLAALDRLGRDAGVRLRKGAGAPVDAVARELLARGDEDALASVAKLHFKTTEKARAALHRR